MTTGLILGAAVWAEGPSPSLRRRTLHAAGLFHRGVLTDLIACGGTGPHPPSEAAVMRDLLVEAGVPAVRIRMEDRSTRTEENIRFALPLLASTLAGPVILITDAYHAPRARLIARRLGLTVSTSSPPLRGASLRQLIKSSLREVPAYLWTWLKT